MAPLRPLLGALHSAQEGASDSVYLLHSVFAKIPTPALLGLYIKAEKLGRDARKD